MHFEKDLYTTRMSHRLSIRKGLVKALAYAQASIRNLETFKRIHTRENGYGMREWYRKATRHKWYKKKRKKWMTIFNLFEKCINEIWELDKKKGERAYAYSIQPEEIFPAAQPTEDYEDTHEETGLRSMVYFNIPEILRKKYSVEEDNHVNGENIGMVVQDIYNALYAMVGDDEGEVTDHETSSDDDDYMSAETTSDEDFEPSQSEDDMSTDSDEHSDNDISIDRF